MNKHPPLAPSCPHVKSNEGKHPMLRRGSGEAWSYVGDDPYYIACIERCAWEDEAERLDAKAVKILTKTTKAGFRRRHRSYDILVEKRQAALRNAFQWKEWSEELNHE